MNFLILLFSVLALAAEGGGKITTGNYTNKAGTRSYKAFIPDHLNNDSGLLVVLHGCFMTADQMMEGTQLNKYAAEKNFVVVYPEQTNQDNNWSCWNWFKQENQQRDTGEASIIAG